MAILWAEFAFGRTVIAKINIHSRIGFSRYDLNRTGTLVERIREPVNRN